MSNVLWLTYAESIYKVCLLDLDLAVRDGDQHAFFSQFNKLNKIKQGVLAYVDNQPLGCGAVRGYAPDSVEVKRMFVRPQYRGQGIAQAVLSELAKSMVYRGPFAIVGVPANNHHELIINGIPRPLCHCWRPRQQSPRKLPRHLYLLYNIVQHLLRSVSLHFTFRSKNNAVVKHRERYIPDIVGRYKIAATNSGYSFGGFH